MFTKMSDKGQIVVPKALRELKGWTPGTNLEAIDVGDGIMLRLRHPLEPNKKLTLDEALHRLKTIVRYGGPTVPTEQLGWSVDLDDIEQ